MVLARWKVVELCRPTSLLSSASPMPSRWRATSSRIANARPSDCTPLRARSSASSSMLGSVDGTRRATDVLRGLAGLSLVFSLVRDVTEPALPMDANSIHTVPAHQPRDALLPIAPTAYHNSN